jgi:hypothetical protein
MMRVRQVVLLLPLCLVAALLGCATILAGKGPVEIPTATTPPGAEVYLDGNRLGTTPVKVQVERKKSHTLVFKQAGYKDASCVLEKSTGAGWVILDIVLGVVPVVVDAVTGDWSKVSGSCTLVMDKAT